MSARLTLRRKDGQTYLERWGVEHPRIGGVFLHKIGSSDPGIDLHNHPWRFLSVVLSGGYWEERETTEGAIRRARAAERQGNSVRGDQQYRKRWTSKWFDLHECHRIVDVEPHTWTLVLHGPKVRSWGFFLPTGFVFWWDDTVDRRRDHLVEA